MIASALETWRSRFFKKCEFGRKTPIDVYKRQPFAAIIGLDCLYLEAGGSGRGIYCNDQFAMFIHASADDGQDVSKHFLRWFLLKSCNGRFNLVIAL